MTAAAIRWLLVPWRQIGVALALVGAAAAPAFLTSAADMWREAAGDEITRRSIDAGPASDRSIVVESNALFAAAGVLAADAAVSERLASIDGLGVPTRTLSTPRGQAGRAGDDRAFTVPIRMVHHAGAIESIDDVRHLPDEFEGAWISSWLAERSDLELGDTIRFFSGAEPEVAGADVAPGGGAVGEVLVVGIYEPLWSPDGSPITSERGIDVAEFWSTLPPALVPVYLNPFNAPNFSLVFVDEAPMSDLGVSGTVSWAAPIESMPQTLRGLRGLVGDLRSLERSVVQDRSISDALDQQASFEPATPQVVSTLPTTLARVEQTVRGLDQPLGSAQAAGIAVGLFVMVSAAAFAVERRRQEFRLLAGEGDLWEIFAARAAVQLALPTAVGAILGVIAAGAIAASVGPSAESVSTMDMLGSVDLATVVAVSVTGIGIGAVVTGLLGSRTIDGARLGGGSPVVATGAIVAGIMAAAFLWFDVQSTDGRSEGLDLAVVSLPLVVLVVAVGIVLAGLGRATRRWSNGIGLLPPIAFLALRRATRTGAGSRIVVGALAVSLGLVGFASLLVDELQRTTDRKLITEIGGETIVDLIGLPDAALTLPADSSIVSFEQTRIAPGSRRVKVVAIDPATALGAITWPDDETLTLAEVLELLDSDAGDDIPAIAIRGETLPRTGSFGRSQPFRYEIVATVDSVPLAASFGSTLLVSADRVDAYGLARTAEQFGVDIDDPELAAFAVVPTSRYRQNVITQQSQADTQAFLDTESVRYRSVESASQRRSDVDLVAPTFAFGYLRWLGVVATVAAVSSLLLYLDTQRPSRALAGVILGRMGLSPAAAALVTSLEVVVLTVVGLATALLVAPVIVARVVPRFDPAPELPPAASLDVPVVALLTAAAVALATVFVGVWLIERRPVRRSEGQVLRDNG